MESNIEAGKSCSSTIAFLGIYISISMIYRDIFYLRCAPNVLDFAVLFSDSI